MNPFEGYRKNKPEFPLISTNLVLCIPIAIFYIHALLFHIFGNGNFLSVYVGNFTAKYITYLSPGIIATANYFLFFVFPFFFFFNSDWSMTNCD